MGLRFRRTFWVARGLRFNLSKSGVSLSLGGRGASMTFGPGGERATVGIPGSGLSYTEVARRGRGIRLGTLLLIALIVLAFFV